MRLRQAPNSPKTRECVAFLIEKHFRKYFITTIAERNCMELISAILHFMLELGVFPVSAHHGAPGCFWIRHGDGARRYSE